MAFSDDDRDELLADLWMRQTNIFLKLVSLMPVLELGIAAGWYNLIDNCRYFLSLLVALIGVVVMTTAWAYLYRATIYIDRFRKSVDKLEFIPEAKFIDLFNKSSLLRWVVLFLPEAFLDRDVTGRKAGLFVPELCVAINGFLAIASICIPYLPVSN